MTPKVFLGGTVNGSKWRDYIIPQLRIEYFNPVVAIWNDEAHEKEQYEKRTCDYCLYVLTPKLTGFYALAEIVHDCHSRPDKVIYCFLKDDQERFFTGAELRSLEELGQLVVSLGGKWCRHIDDVIILLNKKVEALIPEYEEIKTHCFLASDNENRINLRQALEKAGLSFWEHPSASNYSIALRSQIKLRIAAADCLIVTTTDPQEISENTLAELEYGVEFHKPIFHLTRSAQLKPLQPFLLNQICCTHENELPALVCQHFDSYAVQAKSSLTYDALVWYMNQQDIQLLPRGSKRRKILHHYLHNQKHNKFVRDYLESLEKYGVFDQYITALNQFLHGLLQHENFEKCLGVISLLNPISFIPQLIKSGISLHHGQVATGISIPMFLLFVFINICLLMMWVKQRNKGMILSTCASIALICAIIILTLLSK